MENPMQCQVTATLKGSQGSMRCEGPQGHKGHHHFQVFANIHRPLEACRHCDATKPEKRAEVKVQVSFYVQ